LVGLLVTSFIGLPLLGSLVLLVLWLLRRISPVNAWRSTAVLMATALLALIAGVVSGESSLVMAEWLPGMGAMRFDLRVTALIPAGYTTLAALMLWIVAYKPAEDDRVGLKGSLALLALSTAIASFLAGHFLTRYVALELLGLCVAAAPVIWRVKGGLLLSGRTYLLLRIGDAGLLAAILLLRSGSGGVLEIDQVIRSAVLLSPERLAWIVLGFLLVLWVKVGFWPVHAWNYLGLRLPLFPGAWMFATVMPNLGIYLLYRIVPLLSADTSLSVAVRWLGAILALVSLVLALWQSATRPGIIRLLAGIGGLTLYAAASGQSSVVWLSLLVVTPLRPALMLLPPPATLHQRRQWRSVFSLCGFSAALYGLLTVLAVHRTGLPGAEAIAAHFAAGLLMVWSGRCAWRIWRDQPLDAPLPEHIKDDTVTSSRRWVGALLLAAASLLAVVFAASLFQFFAVFGQVSSLPLPLWGGLLELLTSAPLFWLAIIAGVIFIQLQQAVFERVEDASEDLAYQVSPAFIAFVRFVRRFYNISEEGLIERLHPMVWVRRIYDIFEGSLFERLHPMVLMRSFYDVFEKGMVERLHPMNPVRWFYQAFELGLMTRWIDRAVDGVVRLAFFLGRVVEDFSLEGTLRLSVQSLYAFTRRLQRLHTGQLQLNLLLVVSILALMMIVLVFGII
jgi:hypothetical protein